MGTYDTRGGTPASPDVPEPYIFDEEEMVLRLLDGSGASQEIIDEVLRIVRSLCEAQAYLASSAAPNEGK